ncbi:FISUMP domain-containing protein [Arcticibacter sp. MXS-1]|uniref:FISUMP domain-containing protein n=1 Tax=Arcticibacter sp. MXS-1 TaxID=3341726 RepID=UPI0035A932C0
MKTRSYILVSLILIIFSPACRKKKKEGPAIPDQIEIAGKAYRTVAIGEQIWTASNYEGPGGMSYDEANSRPEYGKYYTADEIKSVPLPAGWELPTLEDFKELAESQGVAFNDFTVLNPEPLKKLLSQTRWSHMAGTNESGFNAYPAGYSAGNSKPMDGDISEFWAKDGHTVSFQESSNFVNFKMIFYKNSDQPGQRFNARFILKSRH